MSRVTIPGMTTTVDGEYDNVATILYRLSIFYKENTAEKVFSKAINLISVKRAKYYIHILLSLA